MMKQTKSLQGKRIAILVSDGFEESELISPQKILKQAGATTIVITPQGKKVRSWRKDKWGKYFNVDKNITHIKPQSCDALLLPGGVMSPDKLRKDKRVVKFVKHFLTTKKAIAAICHGPWTLIETGLLKGRSLTSYQSIKTDLINAGAKWQSKKVVKDGNLVTSRSPKDLPAFNKAIIKLYQTT